MDCPTCAGFDPDGSAPGRSPLEAAFAHDDRDYVRDSGPADARLGRQSASASGTILMPAGVTVKRLPHYGRLTLRGREAARAVASRALGLELPSEPCRTSALSDGSISALWLGPDEWLVLCPAEKAGHTYKLLDVALDGIPHALVDVGDRQVAFELAGSLAREVLAVGCSLDLDGGALAVGTCTRTLFEKCEIVLWLRSIDAFHIEVARSLESYLVGHLRHAGRALIQMRA